MQDQSVRLDREQLYGLVWSEPISHVAPRLGLSDVGLAKICERLSVPRPAVGYWMKRKHGKASAAPKLPRVNGNAPTYVTITARERPEAPGVAPPPAVRVPKRLQRPHELVRAASAVLREDRPDPYGRLGGSGMRVLSVRVSREALPRALRLMDAAIKALERRGYTVELRSVNERWETCAVIEDQQISFCLREKVSQKPREPTDQERIEEARWGRSWTKRYDYVRTGRLSLGIEGWCVPHGLRRRWGDSARRPLEEKIGEFVVGIEAVGHAERLRVEEWEEQQRLEGERRARALEEEARRLREERRETQLAELADRWRSASNVREFLAELERKGSEVDGIGDLIGWGRKVADGLDPLTKPAEIAAALAGDDGPARAVPGAYPPGPLSRESYAWNT